MRPSTTPVAVIGYSNLFLFCASTASAVTNYATTSIPHSSVPAGSGTVSSSELSLGDDDYVEVTMYSPFAFFDFTYNSIFVSSNGFVSFSAGSSEWTSAPIPNPAPPNNLIAAWWEDLDPSAGGSLPMTSSRTMLS